MCCYLSLCMIMTYSAILPSNRVRAAKCLIVPLKIKNYLWWRLLPKTQFAIPFVELRDASNSFEGSNCIEF
jgi:hypothetical protein